MDIHLTPKTGANWQLRGQQKQVVTPGKNEKYYLAGALHSGTYWRVKSIPLIVDNYIIHKSRETFQWLKKPPKSDRLFSVGSAHFF